MDYLKTVSSFDLQGKTKYIKKNNKKTYYLNTIGPVGKTYYNGIFANKC